MQVKKPTTRKRQPRKRQNQDENFSPSSDGSMCRKKLSLETKNLSPCNSKDRPLSLLAHQPRPQKATSVSNPCSNMENDRPPSTSVSNPSHPLPLLLQGTHLHPLSPSFPPPLIPATSLMSPVLPLTQIQITQQPTSCSQTSMTVSQPSCSYTLPSISQTSQTTDFQQPVSPPTSHETFSKPFFVKFLTRQIKICQGCRSGYQRDHNGNSLPPPYDIVIGHFERQQYCDRVTGLSRLSRETCIHYHAYPPCIRAKHPTFQCNELYISAEVLANLSGTHKLFLNTTFGLCLS